MKPKQSLLIFSKYPNPGEAKTRLTGPLPSGLTFFSQTSLSNNDAARFSACFIKDMLFKTSLLSDCQTVIHYTPINTLASFQKLLPLFHDFEPQSYGDLGARMQNAFQHAFQQTHQHTIDTCIRSIVLIGSDIPSLPPAFIRSAFAHLEKYPITLGPCLDGGYYLIGLRALEPLLFQDICWGSDQVLEQTINAAHALNLAVKLLPTWYDIDQPADLARLIQDFRQKKANPINAPHTYALLRNSGLLKKTQAPRKLKAGELCTP